MGLVAPGPVGVLPGEPGVGAGFWTGRKNVSDCFLIHSFKRERCGLLCPSEICCTGVPVGAGFWTGSNVSD